MDTPDRPTVKPEQTQADRTRLVERVAWLVGCLRKFGSLLSSAWQWCFGLFSLVVVLAILATILGIVLSIALWQWAVLAIAIFGVFIAETFNTAIESLADVVSPGQNDEIRKVKDYGAAAVLMASILAVIAGIIIFLPEIILLL